MLETRQYCPGLAEPRRSALCVAGESLFRFKRHQLRRGVSTKLTPRLPHSAQRQGRLTTSPRYLALPLISQRFPVLLWLDWNQAWPPFSFPVSVNPTVKRVAALRPLPPQTFWP